MPRSEECSQRSMDRRDQRRLEVPTVPTYLVVDQDVDVLGLPREIGPLVDVDPGIPLHTPVRSIGGCEESAVPVTRGDVELEPGIAHQPRHHRGMIEHPGFQHRRVRRFHRSRAKALPQIPIGNFGCFRASL